LLLKSAAGARCRTQGAAAVFAQDDATGIRHAIVLRAEGSGR
jgi:hypothetical protein